jgi:hypothetical protein
MGATASIGMMAAGAGFSAMASRSAGKAQKQLADYNAQVADMQAADAIVRGREAEERHRLDVRRLIGSQRAALGAGGADVNEGSAMDIQADTAAMGELDAITIRTNAAREAWGYRVQASDYRTRGQIAQAEGAARAVTTLLSTAGSVLYSRYGFGSTTRTRR